MKNILTLNEISPVINDVFTEDYSVSANAENPVAILLRSFKMHDYKLNPECIAIGRAGAGTNNIPVDEYAKQGVVVFNTPGANANAVKELVITALFLGSRKIAESLDWVKTLKGKEDVAKLVEKGKSNFVGPEIMGKKLGVIGLGAIGARVANAAYALGMEVVGYDPYLSIENALTLSRHVTRVKVLDELISTCDYITIHVPLLADNKGMINKDFIAKTKEGVVIINLARGELANNQDMIEACESGRVARYVCDFPVEELIGAKNVVCMPHLGASTPEAEDNCAIMASKQLIDYIENGNIVNSVNYPTCTSVRYTPYRICVLHKNQQNMIAQISSILAKDNINIENFENKNKGETAYTILDIVSKASDKLLEEIAKIEGVIRVREIC